jgi:hypothetical protein
MRKSKSRKQVVDASTGCVRKWNVSVRRLHEVISKTEIRLQRPGQRRRLGMPFGETRRKLGDTVVEREGINAALEVAVLGSTVECLIEGNEVNPAPETERVVPNLWLVIEGEPEFRHRLKSEKLSVEESSGDGVAPSESFDPRLVKSLRLARFHSGHESLAD